MTSVSVRHAFNSRACIPQKGEFLLGDWASGAILESTTSIQSHPTNHTYVVVGTPFEWAISTAGRSLVASLLLLTNLHHHHHHPCGGEQRLGGDDDVGTSGSSILSAVLLRPEQREGTFEAINRVGVGSIVDTSEYPMCRTTTSTIRGVPPVAVVFCWFLGP